MRPKPTENGSSKNDGPDATPAPALGARRSTVGADYRDATGRDHPAESEHDHAHQKLSGESAKMAQEPSPRKDASPVRKRRKR